MRIFPAQVGNLFLLLHLLLQKLRFYFLIINAHGLTKKNFLIDIITADFLIFIKKFLRRKLFS